MISSALFVQTKGFGFTLCSARKRLMAAWRPTIPLKTPQLEPACGVMGHRPTAPFLQRQAGLGAVKRLDLRFLVERQHYGMSRRIHVEADDVSKLLGKPRVIGQLELADPMRLKTVLAPDALHGRDADADLLGHRRRRPMGPLAGRLLQGPSNNRAGDRRAERRNPRSARLVAQEP